MSQQQESHRIDTVKGDDYSSRPPSTKIRGMCREIRSGQAKELEFHARFGINDLWHLALALRENATVQRIRQLPIIDTFELGREEGTAREIVDNLAYHIQHNPQLQVVGLAEHRSLIALRQIITAVSKNNAIHTLSVCEGRVHENEGGETLDAEPFNLRDSKIRNLKIHVGYTSLQARALSEQDVLILLSRAFGKNTTLEELEFHVTKRTRVLFNHKETLGTISINHMRALSDFVKQSSSLSRLRISGQNLGLSMACLVPSFQANKSITSLVMTSQIGDPLLPEHWASLEAILQNASSLTKLIIVGMVVKAEDVIRLANLVNTKPSIVVFELHANVERLPPEVLLSLFPQDGHVQKLSFAIGGLADVEPGIFYSIGNPALSSLTFTKYSLNGSQTRSLLENITNGRLSALESVDFVCNDFPTRADLDLLASCLTGNRRLQKLEIKYVLIGGRYTLSFDQHRRCKVNCWFSAVEKRFDAIVSWLSETPGIFFSELTVELAQEGTVEYVMRRILGRFDHLVKLSMRLPVVWSQDIKTNFLASLQQNESLLTITLQSLGDSDVAPVARFVSRRNRVKSLLADNSAIFQGLWPKVIWQMNQETIPSVTYLAIRKGLGKFWQPDAS